MKGPKVTHCGPVKGVLWYWIARVYFLIFRGWTVVDQIPQHKKTVFIAGPHTSNWDMPFMVAAAAILRVQISWMGKDSLFKFPFGWFMRLLGGTPVDRSSPQGLVAQAADILTSKERFFFAVPASGTRKRKEYWKSGFYHIALAANVPITCGYLDFAKREAGLGLSFVPTGDISADMDRIRAFYKDIQGKYPEKTSRVRLRIEDKSSPEESST